MTRAFTSIGLVVLFWGVAFGQNGSTDSRTSVPAFEAADVHVSAKVRMPSMAAGGLRGTRYLVRQATIVDLISLAYDIDNDKILAGPSWLDTRSFRRVGEGCLGQHSGASEIDASDAAGAAVQS